MKKYTLRRAYIRAYIVTATRCPGKAACPRPTYQHEHGDWLIFNEDGSGYQDTMDDEMFRAEWKLVAPVRKGKR